MNMAEYQELAERTAFRPDQSGRDRLTNFAMGLAGEAGETCDYLKKVIFHGHPMNEMVLKEELGDVLWYVATIATTAGIKLEDVARENVKKLEKRYPDGFSQQKSFNRGTY